MKLWIERFIQHDCRLSWEGTSSLVNVAHHNEETNLTQMEIDLVYLKDKQENIYIHPYLCILSKYRYVYQLKIHFLCV